MAMMFSTKAETLAQLEGRLESARVLPQLRFTVAEWRAGVVPIQKAGDDIDAPWLGGPVIVRSSALREDSDVQSLAGHFLSIANVTGRVQTRDAINQVCESMGSDGKDLVFIQPMLRNVRASGVLFTRDAATGGHYYVLTIDRETGETGAVTSGTSSIFETYYIFKGSSVCDDAIGRLIDLANELEELFNTDALDVEFAFDVTDRLYLLQVRPLAFGANGETIGKSDQQAELSRIAERIEELSRPHPYLLGRRTIFGNMPDWNPAEMIGVRPRTLALSLYKELLTDSIWAYQRDNYGYRNLRSFPLVHSFGGMPYIDVRVSFNSFIPAGLNTNLARKLVDHYLSALEANVALHDKVEFDIIYSCYTLDLPKRIASLSEVDFSATEQNTICEALREVTNGIVHDKRGLWRRDAEKIRELERRKAVVSTSDLGTLEKIYWSIEDCKRYGTLPFAGLARAGFIAIQFLRSFVSEGILTPREYQSFMESLTTVGSRITQDFETLDRAAFLDRYGHLRPGTYDLLSPRYDEAPDRYFDWSRRRRPEFPKVNPNFKLAVDKMRLLNSLLSRHGLEHNALTLLTFIRSAIEEREFAKFVFTRSVSEVLRLLGQYGNRLGFTHDDMSYVHIDCVKTLYATSLEPKAVLARSIEEGRKGYAVTRSLALPPVINSPGDVTTFQVPHLQPNFVTLKSASGPVRTVFGGKADLTGTIVMIPSADPGFDWIFSHNIAGFITSYGGANSHMAIRGSELGIPGVIGAGDVNFERWLTAQTLEIDAAAGQVRIIR